MRSLSSSIRTRLLLHRGGGGGRRVLGVVVAGLLMDRVGAVAALKVLLLIGEDEVQITLANIWL
jgi:streptomycin 6-kinase